ncbi:MAG: hypothetical protein WBI82_09265 [Sphaerochaeta sp.]
MAPLLPHTQAMESDALVSVSESREAIPFEPATQQAPKALAHYQGTNVEPQSFAYAGKTLLPPDTQYLQLLGGNPTQLALYGEGKLQKRDTRASLLQGRQ